MNPFPAKVSGCFFLRKGRGMFTNNSLFFKNKFNLVASKSKSDYLKINIFLLIFLKHGNDFRGACKKAH
jgi:hypothetical protein